MAAEQILSVAAYDAGSIPVARSKILTTDKFKHTTSA